MSLKTDRICPDCGEVAPMTAIQDRCTKCAIKHGRENNKKYYKNNSRLHRNPKKGSYDRELYGKIYE